MGDKQDNVINSHIERKNKEVRIEANTLSSMSAIVTTDIIEGDLKCIIVDSNKTINLKIYLKEYPNIVLYKTIGLQGAHYLPLRVTAIAEDSEMFNYSHEKWALNNRLVFEVEGIMNAEVKFIVRYD